MNALAFCLDISCYRQPSLATALIDMSLSKTTVILVILLFFILFGDAQKFQALTMSFCKKKL